MKFNLPMPNFTFQVKKDESSIHTYLPPNSFTIAFGYFKLTFF